MKSLVFVLPILCCTTAATSQTVVVPSHTQKYDVHSGTFSGRTEVFKAFSSVVRADGAPWLQVHFSQSNLGTRSYITIKSPEGRARQDLNATGLKQWQNFSAYFGGDAVEITLHVAPDDEDVFFTIDNIIVGEWQSNYQPMNICPESDDREFSDNRAIGRLRKGGVIATAWITASGKLATCAHCISNPSNLDIVEFNVPLSQPDGTIVPSLPENQYAVNIASRDWGTPYDPSDDWGVFEAFSNTQTGLTPLEAQGAYLGVVQSDGGATLRVTGYGKDLWGDLRGSYAQQTDAGPNLGRNGYVIEYQADTEGGSSGSPVIDEATGVVIGVNTANGCSQTTGNVGTSTFNPDFWNALGLRIVTIDQRLLNGSSVGTVGRWDRISFEPRFAPPRTFSFVPNSTEIFHGDTNLYSSQKYNNWNGDADVRNHRVFTITPDLGELTANFIPTHGGVSVKTDLIDAPGITADSVQFRDPWFIDYPDPNYGGNLRNRGMQAAEYHTRSSPFNPNYNTLFPPADQPYRGVFLNQGEPNFTRPPYYSVGAPSPQTIGGFGACFAKWDDSNPTQVQFRNPTAQQTGVVFGQAGATAVAKAEFAQSYNAQPTTARLQCL